jgi:hypothetical protein
MSDQSPRDLETEAKELFEAGRAEQPDPAKKQHALDEILSGAAKPRFSLPARRGGLVLIGGGALLLLLLSWGQLGGFGATIRTTASPEAKPPENPPVVVAEAPPAPPAPAPVVEPEPEDPPELFGTPAPSPAPSKPPPPPRREVAAADDADALSRELAMLDRARAELAKDPKAADATLATYRKTFPRGALSTEAEVVQIEALLKLGRRSEAETRARRLLAREKDGVLGKRVENLLAR